MLPLGHKGYPQNTAFGFWTGLEVMFFMLFDCHWAYYVYRIPHKMTITALIALLKTIMWKWGITPHYASNISKVKVSLCRLAAISDLVRKWSWMAAKMLRIIIFANITLARITQTIPRRFNIWYKGVYYILHSFKCNTLYVHPLNVFTFTAITELSFRSIESCI